MDVGCVGEDEVDDDVGGDVDGDPGYRVLTREFRGDLAEIYGACYGLPFWETSCQLVVVMVGSTLSLALHVENVC